MNSPRIKLLVLDGQGVVFNRPFPMLIERLALETGQAIHEVWSRWNRELREPFWCGRMSESEMWRRLAGTEVGTKWTERLESFSKPGPAATRLVHWSRVLPVWMLSNHRADWLLPRLDRFGLRTYFSRVLVSDQMGVVKPDRRAFSAVQQVVAQPNEALFVDDQGPNIASAASLGLTTVHAVPETPWVESVDGILARETSSV